MQFEPVFSWTGPPTGTTVLSGPSSILPFHGVTGIKDSEADLTELEKQKGKGGVFKKKKN